MKRHLEIAYLCGALMALAFPACSLAKEPPAGFAPPGDYLDKRLNWTSHMCIADSSCGTGTARSDFDYQSEAWCLQRVMQRVGWLKEAQVDGMWGSGTRDIFNAQVKAKITGMEP